MTEIHRSHRWGVLRCPTGEHSVPIWSTPKDPSNEAKVIRQALRSCPHRPTKEGER